MNRDRLRSSPASLLAVGLAFLLGLVLAGGWQVAAQDDSSESETVPPFILGYADVVAEVKPAVVTVVNRQQIGGLEGDGSSQEAGRGTGFVVDDQGHVVTNEHVVRGGESFEVILADGTTLSATLVGADPFTDLAVVHVDGEVPATVPFGDSDTLLPGQPVLAIGSPLGAFTNTVTDGIVSAIGRDFPDAAAGGGGPSAIYSDLIQHNADINPGNSGGPLFNLAGEVIGVNTLGIAQLPTTGQPVQGLFFAIPSNTVRGIVEQLITDGQVAYPYLGVGTRTVTPDLASQYELPVDRGVYVTNVEPGSPADQAGIQAGDFITAIAGQPIDAENSFGELLLFDHRPGETVSMTIVREGEERQIEATLGDRGELTSAAG